MRWLQRPRRSPRRQQLKGLTVSSMLNTSLLFLTITKRKNPMPVPTQRNLGSVFIVSFGSIPILELAKFMLNRFHSVFLKFLVHLLPLLVEIKVMSCRF